jgi:CBS domain-containing protein
VPGGLLFLATANLALGLCNTIPVFPLDGGRMLRAILSRRIGWSRATVWTASAGQIVGVVLIGVGVLHYPWLALAGLVILLPANSELKKALARRGFEKQTVRDVMIESAPSVSQHGTTGDLTPLLRESAPSTFVTVEDNGRIIGYIPTSQLRRLAAGPTDPMPLAGLTRPIEVEVPADTTLPDASKLLDSRHAEVAVVVDSDGRHLGIVLQRRLQRATTLWRRLFGDDTGMDG